ncbi:MAG: bifunctional glutamate N-acetyltransferase/amino-acid acetyltransferase ArgJ [Verrucomicrobiales bacterium]
MTAKIKFTKGTSAPTGFLAGAVASGVKTPGSERLDLSLIYSKLPTVSAAAFTANKVKAAPVRVTATHAKSTPTRAIIANSGNANACTGVRGLEDAKTMAKQAATALGLNQREVAVCSTGIIGVPLPIDRITPEIPSLAEKIRERGWTKAAEAIMTSDTVRKTAGAKFFVGKKEITISAMVKGSGMINPNMATMLCFIATDASIDKATLQAATCAAVEQSFNRISVDGDMSTNDTVIVMANGAAGNRTITNGGSSSKLFRQALNAITLKLAKDMVRDGEKATKLVEIQVKGANSHSDAQKIAEAVSNSQLVKCSWNGSDPNWGRVMHVIGYAGAKIREELIDIYFNGLIATKSGLATDTPIGQLKKAVSGPEFTLCIDLHLGDADYTAYTSDLSEGYVAYNRLEYAVKTRR